MARDSYPRKGDTVTVGQVLGHSGMKSRFRLFRWECVCGAKSEFKFGTMEQAERARRAHDRLKHG